RRGHPRGSAGAHRPATPGAHPGSGPALRRPPGLAGRAPGRQGLAQGPGWLPSFLGEITWGLERLEAMNLVIQNLSKRYSNGVQALLDVTLTVRPGMFGLLGPNGAGKSTLMRTVATLQDPDTGSVRLGDIDVLKEKDAVRRLLGYLPQEFGVYPKVRAIDLLDHLARLKGLSEPGLRRQAVEAMLHKTNLWEARHRALGTFSGGMKQRFGIAQALIGDPRLLIVDEPTAGLDPEERVRFHDLLSDISQT